ncbi:ATP-binding cassette domain-containing protein [Dactylosporangium aurantiacum]|uniref:ATP-binding cassette domain-containing protein n=1 Tax=Dactylosporangium aurantiacum TaxID=35754 RepID=A0A9Q9MFP4_9ACTN|nr:ATP-binding cassette domain-containing protein [Dactylosporangium aurantiacum]MDG6107810.1 ATP-binding cassette domain-containing protein [Dactylosporangium aurantiacum]UWZ57413.1 ATP-binding cassette domain-containing protein [Dactylosporangium aurantiacum]
MTIEGDPADELAVPYWLTATAEAASASFGRMVRRLPGLLVQAWRLAWRTDRRTTAAVAVFNLAAGVAAGVGLVNVVGVLDGLLREGPTPDRIRAAVPSLLVMVAAGAARTLLASAATAAQGRLSPQVSQAAELRLLELTTRVDLATFDDADWRDRMQRARDRGIDAAQRIVDHAIELGTNVVSLAAAAGVLAVLHPLLLPLLVLAVVPNFWASVRSARLGYRQQLRLIAVWRRKWMLSDLLAERDQAGELRAFTLQRYLLAEVRRLLDAATREQVKVSAAQVRTNLVGHALGALATGAAYAALIGLLLAGRMDIAVGGAAAYAISTGINALTQVAFSVNHLYEQGLYFGDYESFCALATARSEPLDQPAAPAGFETLSLRDVTFTYPGAARPAVAGVSLTIRRGQTIALVGENGSGKSTLAKLLAALYRPDSGVIAWDGVDLAGRDPDSVREHVAVVMQDPTNWPLSAAENITTGRHDRVTTQAEIEAAADRGDAHGFIVELPRQYRTLLSRHFNDGAELSGGQWQRLAIARAFFRDAPLLICDEPTANLDARAEHAVYGRLRELAAGRTVVLITHRMASVREVDRIYVLDHGRLVEEGTHEELSAAGGLYAQLYALQATAYQTDTGNVLDDQTLDHKM